MKILGISCYYHDAAAAIIDDGKIVAAAPEERFSRKKHDSGFPKNAIAFCLRKAGISARELSWVVFYEKPFVKFERITQSFLTTAPYARESFVHAYKTWIKDKLWIKGEIADNLKVSAKRILFSSHHVSHAASAFFTSPYETSAILTCDGVGEWTTTAWGKGKDNTLHLEEEVKFPHSLGLFYSAFTQFLGFQINEGEYKLMGLAPYGKPRFFEKIDRLVKQSADGSFALDLDYFNFQYSDKTSYSGKLINLLDCNPNPPDKSDRVIPVYADIAASAQKVLEEKLLVIAKNLRNKSGEENLCYSGGVALNGVANWRIFKEAGFKNIFIHPAAGDDGGALGAALYVYHHVLKNPRKPSLENVFLGEENKEDDIERFKKSFGVKSEHFSEKKLIQRVVSYLRDGKVIGWVQGRSEWGPRALGARSILADPRNKKMKDKVNAKIKFREGFRPFAPVTIYEEGDKYFSLNKNEKTQEPLQFMIAVVPVRESKRDSIPAVTHVDGTARPQLVKKSQNPRYYEVIKSFGRETGVSVLLNTSFNLKGEPIVNNVSEAYETFMKSGLDILVIGDHVIKKSP